MEKSLRIKGAESVLNLEPNSSIAIGYHALFGSHDDLMLLEIDEKLLPDILHERVALRGQPDEDSVLCQFPLCENPQDFDGEVHGFAPVIKVAPGNMELVEKWTFMEDVEKNKARLYSWDDLVGRVQASDEELRNGLWALSAVEIDGFWRIVDEKYMDMILRMLLHNSVLNDWSLDALQEDDVVSVLVSDGFPEKLASHCLHVYGSKVDGDVGRSCVWRLDESRRIPGGMQISFDMLEGEVLTEKLGVETWVYSFSVSSLPLTPAERFNMLFRERSKWEWKDLQPYIRDLKVPGLSSEGLLLKYTRRSQPTLDADPPLEFQISLWNGRLVPTNQDAKIPFSMAGKFPMPFTSA
ncbi:hypothetical protein OIU78_018203 [Salix suchowensis]|nr:hypothetical protein OIU78_018203 [Salix suchowensis]